MEKDLSKLSLREDSHSDVEENANKEVICNTDLRNEPSGFFTEIKEHLLRVGDPFLVKAFENYLPFSQGNQKVEQGDKSEFVSVLKKKEQLYAR
jgi:hypothetical protein